MEKPLIPLSYIAEYAYCPRSAYWLLTDAPRLRDENVFIQSGRRAHVKVDEGYVRSKSAKKIESSVRIFSKHLGIIGKIDVLEFYKNEEIVPIEFKHGRKRKNKMHSIQLALMALCLKESFPKSRIAKGAIFFTDDKQKIFVDFTSELLREAEIIAKRMASGVKEGLKPKDFLPQKDERCNGCCFYDLCYY